MRQGQFSRFISSALGPEDGQIGASEAGNRLFEHLVSETHLVAVGVAVVTTAANALNDWRTTVRPYEIARHAPDSAPLRGLLPVLTTHFTVDGASAEHLEAYLAHVDLARSELDTFLDDCEAISAPRAALVHARPLQTSWRALAKDTRAVIVELEERAPEPLPDLFRQNTLVISALLSGAGSGLKPCLDDAGRLYVPPLPQRRRAPRRAVLQNCLVHGPHATQTGFVRDASAGGLGLGRVSGLKRGDRIRVDFANGRQFSGTVAWVTGSSAGLRFDTALKPTDCLIAP